MTCSVALAFGAPGAKAEKGKNTGEPKRKAPPVGQGSQRVGATTGKPATAQAVHQNRTVHQIGIPEGDGKRTTVGKSTGAGTPTSGSKPKRIAREQGFKRANTPRTEVTPAAHLQQNGGIQQLNTSISEAVPAAQLGQNSGVQLINAPISGTAPALKFDQNKTITSLLGAAGGSQLSPPPGGWKTEFNPANGPQTGGQLPPPPAVGPTIIPFNPANGPQTESARTGSGLPPPPPMVTSSDPANAENKSTSEIAPAVQFKQNRRIQGSEQWVDSNYEVFRNYRSEWHDRDWWRTHYSRIAFGVGGWYYRNASYWFPAWGYDPNAYYAYDGPIYAHKSLPPDQVIADVQEALQKQAYYRGQMDGLLGPPTRAALGDYQRDHNLYITSAIDSPTLQSLGIK